MSSFKSYFFIIFSLFVFLESFSQENFLAGYILTNDQDSSYGFIDFKDWEYSPRTIEFKDSINSKSVSIYPMEIMGFGVNNEHFVSAIVKSNISPFNLDELNFESSLQTITDTVFLQALVIGDQSLFYTKNEIGNECFYIRHKTEYELLEYKRYYSLEDGKKLLKENTKYLGQLSFYMKDLESIQSKLATTQYNSTSLEKLFRYYHDSSGKSFYYIKKKNPVKLDFGVLAGFSVTSIRFQGEGPGSLKESDFKKSLNFTAGILFDIILPKNQGKWSFNNELIITSFATDGYYEDFENNDIYTYYTTVLEYSYFKINNMIRYKYPINSIFIYINAGISNGFVIRSVNQKTKESKFYNTESTTFSDALSFTRNHEQGLLLGVGLKHKQYSLETRYELGNGMSNYTQLSSTTNRLYLYMGYHF